ncbi:MAG: ribosome-associated translation inhibitor RaiA [Chloroflexi bacterium]|nr:ribosome-associated translation inhibitor RaiA [Chloroflexota bacterium]MBP8058395.1 ribosome-associated translation inhibitor RaiA [Chloroflexota bacterium]
MNLTVHARNMEITPRLQNYVEKKTGRLDRYMPNLAEVRVDLSEQKARNAVQRQVAQITVRDDRGTILRAEEQSNDMFAAVDAVVDKLYRQINRYRGKRQQRWRPTGDGNEVMGEPLPIEASDEESEERRIVRQKGFSLRPMLPDEALDQMELLGHDFFVFFNAENELVNVVYRRKDGDYGLLMPDLV